MSIKNERLLSKAKKLLKKGQFNEARDIYLNILKSFPKNLEAKKALLVIDQMPQNNPQMAQMGRGQPNNRMASQRDIRMQGLLQR